MFLIVSGNVTFKQIIDIVKNNEALNKCKSNYPVIYEELKEDKKVVSEYQELTIIVGAFTVQLLAWAIQLYVHVNVHESLFFHIE